MYTLLSYKDICGFVYSTLWRTSDCSYKVGDTYFDTWDNEMLVLAVDPYETHKQAVGAMLRANVVNKRNKVKLDPNFVPRSKRK